MDGARHGAARWRHRQHDARPPQGWRHPSCAAETGAELCEAEHRDLAIELALGGGHMCLLTEQDGGAFTTGEASGLPAPSIRPAFPMSACAWPGQGGRTTLAEVGCTPTIAAIAGHRTQAEVERCAKAADRKRPAAAAIHRLERADTGTPRTQVAP
jgi:hypothetical protein